jgi:hypothetical protein
MRFILEQSDESLTTHSGLALVGLLLNKVQLGSRLNDTIFAELKNPEISHAEVVVSYLGLLAQGKSDFEHIEPFRQDGFFAMALGCQHVPSAPTLRQRLDAAPHQEWETILREEAIAVLQKAKVKLTPTQCDLVPLDADVSPFDNSDSHKEGVAMTYAKVPGYAPIFFYVGQEGYLLDLELRHGSVHSQNGTAPLLKRAIASARKLTPARLLVRLDAGNDSLENIQVCDAEPASDYLIKRNLRQETKEHWLQIAQAHGELEQPRAGKKVWTGSVMVDREGFDHQLRVVFEVIERTIDKTGQTLLMPELEVATYWTSLTYDAKTIFALYREHGTMEQFHSEIKSELDLERLPSGKFATNSLVLHIGMLAYNLLRVIGQESLNAATQPLRKKVKRRRVRTVIQNLITLATRVVHHARSWKLAFGGYSPWYPVYRHVYLAFSP